MAELQLPHRFGDYELVRLLAKGGMGEIYLAYAERFGGFRKQYAVKRLLPRFAGDPDVSARFVDEARLGARLQHPNIVEVFDLGRTDNELYLATEFVDGFDLRRVLRFCFEHKKRIPLDVALFIVSEVLGGLAYAHRQVDGEGHSIHLIHRDISPQNVLVSFEGEVKIIDFGLAKSTQRSQETQANVVLGNFGYMSPEQARGEELGPRTDVYSTGIVLFELLTRTKRFVDENPLRLLEMVAHPTPVSPSDRAPELPRAIDWIYARATAPEPGARYAGADAFRADVLAALHRLNPRASREILAGFMNHLFFGGAEPPLPPVDALDRSVAVRVEDVSLAWSQERAADPKSEPRHWSDDEPQTGSHALMRACSDGDELSHFELTGERDERTDVTQDQGGVEDSVEEPTGPVPSRRLPRDVSVAPAPPATFQEVADDVFASSVAHPSSPDGPAEALVETTDKTAMSSSSAGRTVEERPLPPSPRPLPEKDGPTRVRPPMRPQIGITGRTVPAEVTGIREIPLEGLFAEPPSQPSSPPVALLADSDESLRAVTPEDDDEPTSPIPVAPGGARSRASLNPSAKDEGPAR